MIESPIQAPPPSGSPVEPPTFIPPVPDAPPPDLGALHDDVCEHCLAPIHADQAACLSCGKIVERDGGGMTWRRGAAASVAALLLIGGAVGAAVAGLPHGKKVPKVASAKKPTGQAFGQKPIPPATATPAPSDTAPLPSTKSPKTPPAIAGGTPGPSAPSGGGSPTPGPRTTPGGGGSHTRTTPHHKTTKHRKKHTAPGASSAGLFTTGVSPIDGELFDPSASNDDHPDQVINTYDSDADTAWSTKTYTTGDGTLDKPGVGVRVEVGTRGYKALGIVTRTPGFRAQIYYTDSESPPSTLGDWKPASTRRSIGPKQRIALQGDARKGKWYLVWITSVPKGKAKSRAKISEIQLLQ
jgi:hypothetical protein